MNLHELGLVVVAVGLGGLLVSPMAYRSGVRDERERIARHLLAIRRRQETR